MVQPEKIISQHIVLYIKTFVNILTAKNIDVLQFIKYEQIAQFHSLKFYEQISQNLLTKRFADVIIIMRNSVCGGVALEKN